MHVVIYTRYWKIGGIERIIQSLTAGLRPMGYRFSIITEDLPDPDNQFDLGPEIPIYFREASPFTAENEAAMRRLLLRLAPDVAVAMGSSRALYKLPRSLVDTDIPVVLSEHNSPAHICESLFGSADFLGAIRSYGDLVHVLVEDFGLEAPEPERIRVIGNPVARQTRFADVSDQRGRRPEGNVILSVARYDLHQKQQHILIEAFARIAERHPDWRLELYGDDWNEGKARLADLIAAHGLEQRVGLHGHSGNVAARMLKAQILAFPSAFEGWGLAATEALSHGLPVIAFAECSGVNSLVLDGVNGILVDGPVTEIEAFAAGLERLMTDEALRKRLAAAGPASVAPYSVEEFLRKWDALLREAAALRGRNRLAALSFMERDYLRLVASGKLFDQAHAERKKHRDLAQRLRGGQEAVAPTRSLKAVLRGLAPVGLWRLLHRGRKALRRLRRS